jgi:hypothetical protein
MSKVQGMKPGAVKLWVYLYSNLYSLTAVPFAPPLTPPPTCILPICWAAAAAAATACACSGLKRPKGSPCSLDSHSGGRYLTFSGGRPGG